MKLEDFKIGCQQWTREELLESLYEITKQNNKAIEYIKNETKDMPLNGCKQRLNKVLNILKGDE